jgi:hypothetical protein
MRCESGLSISARKNRSRTLGENSFRIVQNGVRSQESAKKKLPAGSFVAQMRLKRIRKRLRQ